MNQLIQNLQKEDRQMARIIRGVKIMYLVLIPAYALLYLLAPDFTISQRAGGMLSVMGFAVFIILFQRKSNEFKQVDYALPTTQMLTETIKRYKLWKPELLWALVAVSLVDLGLTISKIKTFTPAEIHDKVIDTQIIMIPAIFIGLIIGIIWWYIKHKPLRDQAQKLLDELINE